MTAVEKPLEFDHIFLHGKQVKSAGKIKFVAGGLGWRESATGSVTKIRSEDIKKVQWLHAARDYQLKIHLKDGVLHRFDGFPKETFDVLREYVRENYGLVLETRDLSLKGWNWGKADVSGPSLEFFVQGKPMFEVPLGEISNVMVSAKNEVTIEMNQSDLPSSKKLDSLVDVRLYIPGVAEEEEHDEKSDTVEEGGTETIDAATTLCNTIKSAAEIGGTGGAVSIVTFQELPFLVPRGRYEADLYNTFMRLRGKSYDYKIPFSSIIKLFMVPKPDDVHVILVIALDPPLRQGQTRYPFLVLQFSRDDLMEISLNLTDEELKGKYSGKLQKEYEGPVYEVVSSVLRVIADKKVIVPGHFKASTGAAAVKCSVKANEGHVYPLEKNLLFIPKPAILIPHEDVSNVIFCQVDGSTANSRSFDIKFIMKNKYEHQFSNIPKEELNLLEDYFREKHIRFQNEISEVKRSKYAEEVESSDEDVAVGSGEEEESTDEDYQEGDSGAESNSADSEEGSGDGEDVVEEDE